MSEDDPRAIKAPVKSPVSTARSIIEAAAAETIPFAGMVAAVGRAAFPPAEEKAREAWEGQVTDRVNQHDRALRGEVTISGTTAALALWMAQTSSDGLHEPHVELSDVAAGLGEEHTAAAIEEAAEELESLGLVEFSRFIGADVVRPRWQLFAALDPHAKGWSVDEDARVLAGLVVAMADGFAAHELEQRSGFGRRRFNPALSKLLTMFDAELVSGEIQPDYAANYAQLSGGVRARLRRFINGE